MIATWNPGTWSQHTLDVLIAFGTVGAVIVALAIALDTSFARRRHRPTVGLTHDPDADRTVETWMHRLASMGDRAAFVRLGVSDEKGRHAAEDVQVFVVSVNGERVNFGPLGWTHIGEMIPLGTPGTGWAPGTKQTLGPGITRTVDLGYAVAGQTTFALAVWPEPLTEANKVKTGDIDLVLAVSPRNADAQHFTMTLSFDGPWLFDHEGDDDGSDAWKKIRVSKLPKRTKPPG